MTTTHTPGPWTFDSTATGATVYQEMAGTIATIPADLLAYRANARLIAAAPAMLKALQRLTHPMADDEDLRDALAVIARATGQPIPDDTGDDEGPEPPYAGYESQAVLNRMNEVRRLEALRREGLIP